MKHSPVHLVLRDGWECLIELQAADGGAVDGRGELTCQGKWRCLLVVLNAPSPQEAIERVTRRAHAFIEDGARPEDDGD